MSSNGPGPFRSYRKSQWGSKCPGPALVFVKAEWCGHCQAAKPEVAKAARLLGSAVPTYAIDADKHPDLVNAWGVEGFPTIFYVSQTGRRTDYGGERRGQAIGDWVCNKSNRCG